MISALEAEVTALQEQLTEACQEAEAAQQECRDALGLRLGAEWDDAVSVLVQIGTRLVAQGVRYPLTTLKLPTFTPGGNTIGFGSLSANT
ncbi:hypothetical protein D3C71_2075180 [compost metagenome]